MKPEARVFHRDRLDTARPQRPAEQNHRLGQARRDHYSVGSGRYAAHPTDVVGERFAQGQRPNRSWVTQPLIRHAVERPAIVAQPLASREEGGVGQSADKADHMNGFGADRRTSEILVSDRQDSGARSLAPTQISSAARCSYASTTTLRATPSSRASVRDGG